MISLNELLKHDLTEGSVIVFPTDTVYGIGTKLNDKKGEAKIYQLKKRSDNKPLAILISAFSQVKDWVEIVNPQTFDLINKYWPGAVTFIFKKKPDFDYPFPTIGFRIPDSKIAWAILNKYGPLSTTSVNISGEEPLNNIMEIAKKFKNNIDYLVDDEAEFSETSSTVVDLTTSELKILRQGDVIIKL